MECIGKKFETVIVYCQRLHTLLVNRANYLKRKQRVLKGGAPCRKFFQRTWDLKLHKTEVKTIKEQVLEVKLSEANKTRKCYIEKYVQCLIS